MVSTFSGLIKTLSCKSKFFQLAFEAQPACVSQKFLNCSFAMASYFFEALFHGTQVLPNSKAERLEKYVLDTSYILHILIFTRSRSITVTIDTKLQLA